jgi:hypothetical protein
VRPLGDQAFNQRLVDLLTRLDKLGRTTATDRGGAHKVRLVTIEVRIPGQEGNLGLSDEVLLRYEEWWRKSSIGWVRVRYNYNFLDVARGGRWGYHLHAIRGSHGQDVPHRVCVEEDSVGEGAHYAAHEIDLLAAHDEFERHYAEEIRVTCVGLTRLVR